MRDGRAGEAAGCCSNRREARTAREAVSKWLGVTPRRRLGMNRIVQADASRRTRITGGSESAGRAQSRQRQMVGGPVARWAQKCPEDDGSACAGQMARSVASANASRRPDAPAAPSRVDSSSESSESAVRTASGDALLGCRSSCTRTCSMPVAPRNNPCTSGTSVASTAKSARAVRARWRLNRGRRGVVPWGVLIERATVEEAARRVKRDRELER